MVSGRNGLFYKLRDQLSDFLATQLGMKGDDAVQRCIELLATNAEVEADRQYCLGKLKTLEDAKGRIDQVMNMHGTGFPRLGQSLRADAPSEDTKMEDL